MVPPYGQGGDPPPGSSCVQCDVELLRSDGCVSVKVSTWPSVSEAVNRAQLVTRGEVGG